MTIGKKIKNLRIEKDITQSELAAEIGVSSSAVQYWERDRSEPSIFNCIIMADIFDVTLDELCCRENKGIRKEHAYRMAIEILANQIMIEKNARNNGME